MLGTLLASAGITIFNQLIENHGENLVVKGIEKATGIKLDEKDKLTEAEKQLLIENQYKILELDFKQLEANYKHDTQQEEERTKRWLSDNTQKGINSKIRPYTLIYLMAIISIFALFDGNVGGFAIKPEWTSLFTTLSVTAFSGYFVLRTYEKTKGKI